MYASRPRAPLAGAHIKNDLRLVFSSGKIRPWAVDGCWIGVDRPRWVCRRLSGRRFENFGVLSSFPCATSHRVFHLELEERQLHTKKLAYDLLVLGSCLVLDC